MDDFIREGGRIRRSERTSKLDLIWNVAMIPPVLGLCIWIFISLANTFDHRNAGSWLWVAIFVALFYQSIRDYFNYLNVTEHSIYFDLRERKFGEVFSRRWGPPIERAWPLDAIEAIEIVKPSGIMDRLTTRGAVARIRVRGERRPFEVCAAQDPLKVKAVVERVKTHLGRS